MWLLGFESEPPRDVIVALICDRWHCLPDEVLDHDYASLMRAWETIVLIDDINAKRSKQQTR